VLKAPDQGAASRVQLRPALAEGNCYAAAPSCVVDGSESAVVVLAPPGVLAKDKDQAPAKEEGKGPPKEEPHPGQDDDLKLPPFPQDKTVHQSIELGGRTLNYNATVGSVPVLDEKGKTVADVMFIAYTVAGAGGRSRSR